MSTLAGNKGEWSEFYAFLKLLDERKLFAADANLDPIQEKYFDVLQVVRYEAKTGKKVYDLRKFSDKIRILSPENIQLAVVNSSVVKPKVAAILTKITSETETTFQIPTVEALMADLRCTQIKAESLQKSDIFLVIHDRISPVAIEQGFSVKSMLGGASTLLNASGATNFTFRINDLKVASEKYQLD